MRKTRIGKLERWILFHAYMKTVKKELPGNWKISRAGQFERESFKRGLRHKENYDWSLFWKYLFKSEILLNYFDLELSLKEPMHFNYQQEKFRVTNKYRSALASFTRITKQMKEKGLIETWYSNKGYYNYWVGIVLTGKGKEIANNLLKVNTCTLVTTVNNKN